MNDGAHPRRSAGEPVKDELRPGESVQLPSGGIAGQALAALLRFYPVPPASVAALLAAGAGLGLLGDALLHDAGPPGLNLSLWVAFVAASAMVLCRRAAQALDRGRFLWLMIGVFFSAGLAWRDAPPLKLLALGCATLSFALAAHRPDTAWLRRAGLLQYAGALALGALHAWTAAALALVDAVRSRSRIETGHSTARKTAAAVARGLLIAAPLVAVFGALFISADPAFEELAAKVVRFDFERVASHVFLFLLLAWLSTGYLRGFLSGTELPRMRDSGEDVARSGFAPKPPVLGITEVATVLAALDLLFLLFVVVQARYLFAGDALVQGTPGLTYAQYARRGFFELVAAVVLVVPVLLAADWVLDRRNPRDGLVFRALAGVQVALVLAIAASALERLRLYRAAYGLTESRFYASVLLLWIGAVLLWLAATVLRGRRDRFAFGMLTSGLAVVALLFLINPDAVVARTNLARLASAEAADRFDVAYAASLSADAAPVLLAALPGLPPAAQCPLARRMLRRWGPERERSIRSWNGSVARATAAVRASQAQLRAMLGAGEECPPSR